MSSKNASAKYRTSPTQQAKIHNAFYSDNQRINNLNGTMDSRSLPSSPNASGKFSCHIAPIQLSDSTRTRGSRGYSTISKDSIDFGLKPVDNSITSTLNLTPVRQRPASFASGDDDIACSKRFHSLKNFMKLQVLEEIKVYQGILSNERKVQTRMIGTILAGVKEFTSFPNNVQLGKAIVSIPEMRPHIPVNIFNDEFGSFKITPPDEKKDNESINSRSPIPIENDRTKTTPSSSRSPQKSPSRMQTAGNLISRRWSLDQPDRPEKQRSTTPPHPVVPASASKANPTPPRQPWNSGSPKWGSGALNMISSRLDAISRPRSFKVMQTHPSPTPRSRLSLDNNGTAADTAPINRSQSVRHRTITVPSSRAPPISTPPTPSSPRVQAKSPPPKYPSQKKERETPSSPRMQRRLSAGAVF